jgi:hypothetical protein
MNKALRTLLAFSTLLSAAALPVFGSEIDQVRVNVPFAFKAGSTLLPAGEYTMIEDDSKVITIRGDHGSVMVLGSPTTESPLDKSSVTFDRTSSGYVLKCVHAWGKATASTVVNLSNEK